MQKLIVGVIALFISVESHGQRVVPVVADNVTLYLSGAEIHATENVKLTKGIQTVIFKGLSHKEVPKSINVAAGDASEITSVVVSAETLDPEISNPAVRLLLDSVGRIEDRLSSVTNQIESYNVEKRTLEQNEQVKPGPAGVTPESLTRYAEFFRDQNLKINIALTRLKKQEQQLNNRLTKLKSDLTTEKEKSQTTRYDLIVTVSSKSDGDVLFQLSYLVDEAHWDAAYDISASDLTKPIALKYNAQIYNQTGIDWKGIHVSLSTGDMSQNTNLPSLTTWVLNYQSKENEGLLNFSLQNQVMYKTKEEDKDSGSEDKGATELIGSFEVPGVQNFLSRDLPYKITVSEESLPAQFEYVTIPKLEPSAFLTAKVTGWEKLNLIDGPASVFFANAYVGEFMINTQLISDTLDVSFGRDRQIVISRTKVEDRGNTPSLGGKRAETLVYEIQLRNNHSGPVRVKVLDQIPVTQERDISVDVADVSGATIDIPSGRLLWFANLDPGGRAKYKVAFTVKYPKNKNVVIRKNRSVRTPRYRK